MAENVYFTCPVSVLQEAFTDIKKVANNIIELSVYLHSIQLDEEDSNDEMTNLMISADYLHVRFGNPGSSLENAKKLYNKINRKEALMSLKTEIVFDFLQNNKTQYEIACFCAYASFKSILGKKPYIKMTNEYFLTRFFGFNSQADVRIQFKSGDLYKKYSSRYMMDKIKETLIQEWGLKLYGKHIRGFYASYTVKYEDLVYYAEKNRIDLKTKERKQQEAEIRKRVLMRIELEKAS